MNNVQMMAFLPLYGDYGRADAGEIFATNEATATDLETRGLAGRYRPPVRRSLLAAKAVPAAPENKVLPAPPANKRMRAR